MVENFYRRARGPGPGTWIGAVGVCGATVKRRQSRAKTRRAEQDETHIHTQGWSQLLGD
jgi:hypothetical protein